MKSAGTDSKSVEIATSMMSNNPAEASAQRNLAQLGIPFSGLMISVPVVDARRSSVLLMATADGTRKPNKRMFPRKADILSLCVTPRYFQRKLGAGGLSRYRGRKLSAPRRLWLRLRTKAQQSAQRLISRFRAWSLSGCVQVRKDTACRCIRKIRWRLYACRCAQLLKSASLVCIVGPKTPVRSLSIRAFPTSDYWWLSGNTRAEIRQGCHPSSPKYIEGSPKRLSDNLRLCIVRRVLLDTVRTC
jgi:hypothetical protein